ncbi:component of 80S ribosome and 40S small subunit [Scenedesmus sp. NREL 46B-D3]|nr:component of 80S ribosome and 40S small subunit [Scenedesmus sp. NREL 46B-D3]
MPSKMHSDIDLLNSVGEAEAQAEALGAVSQQLLHGCQCAGCFQITTVFSHSQSVQLCSSCSTVLATPTGGKCRLTEGASFRRKSD